MPGKKSEQLGQGARLQETSGYEQFLFHPTESPTAPADTELIPGKPRAVHLRAPAQRKRSFQPPQPAWFPAGGAAFGWHHEGLSAGQQ